MLLEAQEDHVASVWLLVRARCQKDAMWKSMERQNWCVCLLTLFLFLTMPLCNQCILLIFQRPYVQMAFA